MPRRPDENDEHHVLPRFRQAEQERLRLDRLERDREQAGILTREVERAVSQGVDVSAPRSGEGDPRRLRGIPVVARGVPGALPGTQPEREAVARNSGRNRRRL